MAKPLTYTGLLPETLEEGIDLLIEFALAGCAPPEEVVEHILVLQDAVIAVRYHDLPSQ